MNGLKIEHVTLTDEAVDYIFRTAIDAGVTYGFGYWAELKETNPGPTLREGDLIKSITLKEREKPGRKRVIDKSNLVLGIAALLTSPKGLRSGGLDEEYPDGPTCEMILQYAMFGEQVYG